MTLENDDLFDADYLRLFEPDPERGAKLLSPNPPEGNPLEPPDPPKGSLKSPCEPVPEPPLIKPSKPSSLLFTVQQAHVAESG